MTSDAPARTGLHPSLVLSAYIEPLLRGRRVALLGDATIGLADELSKRGARLVHAYDPAEARAAEALARALPAQKHAVTYAVLAADIGVRDGAFDLIVIPDLSIFPDPTEILRRARRLLAPTGAAVIVTPNLRAGARRLLPEAAPPARGPAPPGYYELYDLVSLQFAKVRMAGQAPFVGYTIADFAPHGEPDVSVDTSFLPSSEEPEHFIAIAGDRPLAIDSYTVVELPWADVGAAQGLEPDAEAKREDDRIALTETRTRLALVGAELEKIKDRQQLEAKEAEAKAATAATLSARVVELELALEARDARARELEARAGDNHVRAERLTHQIRDLDEELRRQRDRGTKLSKALDDEKKARTKAELELGMIRGAPPAGNPKDKERIDALTAELQSAQGRVTELEMEMVATRRRGQEVPRADVEDPRLRERLAELEAAVSTALREVSLATSSRDSALEQLRRAEAKLGRLVQLEAELAATLAAKEALAEQLRDLTAARAEADRKIAELGRRAVEDRAKIAELDRAHGEAKARIADLEQRIEESEALVAESAALLAEAEKLRVETEQRDASLAEQSAVAQASLAELAALEAQLRDRGQAVAALKRDLRESERIGKELLGELDAARSKNGAADGPRAAAIEPAEDLRARLNALAESAARSEADLQAARWQIAKLEREVAERGAEAREPTAVQIELEAALAAARDEVAALRRAIGAG